VSAAELHGTVSAVEMLSAEEKCSDSEFISPATIKRTLVFFIYNVGFPTPSPRPEFIQIWIFMTDFHASYRHKISRKSIRCEPRWHMLTDGQTNERKNGRGEANRRFSPM
jgi:hypothetical protein